MITINNNDKWYTQKKPHQFLESYILHIWVKNIKSWKILQLWIPIMADSVNDVSFLSLSRKLFFLKKNYKRDLRSLTDCRNLNYKRNFIKETFLNMTRGWKQICKRPALLEGKKLFTKFEEFRSFLMIFYICLSHFFKVCRVK